jgi:predicted dehydrogenase
MTPLRTAILGCGGFAARHAENLIKHPEQFSLIGFCDIDRDRAASFANKYGTKGSHVYEDHHDLIDQVPLDLLVIVLPPFAHTDEVKLASERGIHLLIEKPIALTHEKAWQMVEDCEKAGIRTQVGFMYRFGAAIDRVKNLLVSGEAGKIGLLRAGYFCNHLHAPWWRFKEKAGGQVFEQAIHLVDLMRYLGGEVESVFSVQRNLFHQDVPGGYTVEDVSSTILNFRTGAVGSLTASNFAIPWKWAWDLKIISQSLVADLTDSNHASITYTNVHNSQSDTVLPQEKVLSEQDDYMEELQDLFEAIQTGRETRTPMREGAKTLDIVLSAGLSADTGLPVNI